MPDTPEEQLLNAIFAENHLADFNDLVRAAHCAQEGFDNWDRGKTYYPRSIIGGGTRVCTLDEVCAEWSQANIALIKFVQQYGDELLKLEKVDTADQLEPPN